jgi:hypothetical protein
MGLIALVRLDLCRALLDDLTDLAIDRKEPVRGNNVADSLMRPLEVVVLDVFLDLALGVVEA